MELYDVLTVSRKIAAATPENRIVAFTANDGEAAQATAASAKMMGVLRRATTAAGQTGDVGVIGIFPCEYGETLTPGTRVTADANGKAVAVAAGEEGVGYAWENGDDGTIGSIKIDLGEQPA